MQRYEYYFYPANIFITILLVAGDLSYSTTDKIEHMYQILGSFRLILEL